MATQNEIIEQLKELRGIQRTKLSNSMDRQYHEDIEKATKEIDINIDELTEQNIVLINRYDELCNSWWHSKEEVITLSANIRKVQNEIIKLRERRQNLVTILQAEHEKTKELIEFDIETEQIILAHMCDVHLICGNKKVLPMIEEPAQ